MNINNYINYDRRFPFNVQEESASVDIGFATIKDLSISSSNGKRIVFYLVIPKNGSIFPAVEFFHWLEPESEDSNRTQFLSQAKDLAKQGILSILPDAFWSTNPQEYNKHKTLWWKTDFEHDKDLCITQIIDFLRIHDYLLSLNKVDKNRIVLVGHDFGAMFGSILLNFNKNYKTFVLIAATTKFYHWFKFGSPYNEESEILQEYGRKMAIFDPINYIRMIAPSPILMQFAKDDFYVPSNIAQEFIEKASEPKVIKWYDAKHGMNEKTFEDMKDWIKKYI
ncbi:MAG: alpha/beta hydrolase family protein [Candidatus Hodarchaeales archaeon]